MSNLIESMINENQKFSKDTEKKSKKIVNESYLASDEVYIIVKGGMVQDVFATTSLDVTVIDLDTNDPIEKDRFEELYKEVKLSVAGNELKNVW